MFDRLIGLIGEKELEKIKNIRVLLVGVGGVGGYTLEALVRSGFQNLTIVDGDTIDESNLNRQIIALNDNIGNIKVEEAKKRVLSINSSVNINIIREFLTKDNFDTLLNNNYDLIYNNDNTPILMVGLSSLNQKEREIDKAYKYFSEETHNSNIYTITIMSETDDLDDITSRYNSNLVLAGNSLNGEIRLPFVGGIITKEGSKKYKDSYYKVNDSEIYVSNGIGSPEAKFRLFNRPSINLFRLTNKK